MLKYHIQTVDVGSGGSQSITFTNIPQIYDDLLIVLSARCSSGTNNGALLVSFNGDNAYSNGSTRWLQGNGSSASSSSATFAVSGIVNGGTSTSNTFSSGQFYISNYKSTGTKLISQDWVTEENASQAFQRLTAGISTIAQPITSMSLVTDNPPFVQYSSASLYGIKRGSDGAVNAPAIGGTVTTSGGYTIHTFTTSGTFIAAKNLDVEYLVIGGGGGGAAVGGGGGAGGYRCSVPGEYSGGGASAEPVFKAIAGTSYAVTVGAGGAGNASDGPAAFIGADSSFGPITAIGGGAGAGYATNATNGGSGGGSRNGSGAQGAGFANQGFPGGFSFGGGGGASAAGSNGNGGDTGGVGGNGLSSSITGTSVTRAGGGGSGSVGSNSASGGAGGGGTGATVSTAGATNTGSGGGGGNFTSNTARTGRAGGSGIVIVRYRTPA